MLKHQLLTAAAAGVLAAPALFAQGTYKKELPDSLIKHTKVTEEAAAKAALARVPKGEIQTVELEREKGRLIYSYDIKVPGKSGIDEVAVSATTGKVVAFSHETPADEKKEAAADAKKAAKGTKKP
jgi:Peptidase propeptide and YPEB domain